MYQSHGLEIDSTEEQSKTFKCSLWLNFFKIVLNDRNFKNLSRYLNRIESPEAVFED